ncbi:MULTISPECIES: ATP-binding cassette domain-containing protein [unclassified Nonomuraea]|uniref:ATP-binding cassette domain-containing protein n=1 Tax=unclassified Nonomuraea TaxID=2593643 RepID=UPI0014872591|nr:MULTISPECIES: ABC transporter ATP-binding protein [unclassified Nonomuraea]
MAGIEVTALHKRYPDGTVAVDHVDLSIGDGELFVMLGPSGCGKTTTLRAMAGLERQTTGDIRIGDTLVNDLPPAERDIAMVFHFYALYPHLRTRDNLAFPLRAEGLPKAEVRERVDEAARLMRLVRSWTGGRAGCPAGSSSASRLLAPWYDDRAHSSWTNLSPIWTRS